MSIRRGQIAIALLAPLVLGAVAHAGPVMMLIDPQLRVRPVAILAFNDDGLRLLDAGAERTVPMAEVLALAEAGAWNASMVNDGPARPAAERAGLGLLELVDGQRWVGGPAVDGEALAPDPSKEICWNAGPLGKLVVKLDRVSRLRIGTLVGAASASAPSSPPRDRVLLANGDWLEGFVERLGRELWISASGSTTKVDVDRVREVVLTNPPEPPAGGRLWIDSGSIIRADRLASRGDPQGGGVTVYSGADAASSRPVLLRIEQIRGFVADAAAIVPLANIAIADQRAPDRPGAKRVRAMGRGDAPLGAADLELPGPMVVEWPLPRGAKRFAAGFLLPPAAREWGDCDVLIEVVDATGRATRLDAKRLNSGSPSFQVNVEFPQVAGIKLRVTVAAGAFGPIQDRVIIRRGLILAR